jgi:hypothetical protein
MAVGMAVTDASNLAFSDRDSVSSPERVGCDQVNMRDRQGGAYECTADVGGS